MQFRDLKRQYQNMKPQIDAAISQVLTDANFISGSQVKELEAMLADYVGVKHCITCANGTDALEISLMAMEVKAGDAVFVPDFTFFASAEAPARLGATPVFVDIDADTYNMSPACLEAAIQKVLEEGKFTPKAIVAVDLFGMTANYTELRNIADKYGLLLLEDGAQGFGAEHFGKKACSFGDISTTSFFPAKPLGCYGDGGAIFTNSDEYAALIRSYCVHGKGADKYHNVRIGTNSRLDTLQAAVLIEKLKVFKEFEVEAVNKAANLYTENLQGVVSLPTVPEGYYSSWAQYTIRVKSSEERSRLQAYLKEFDIPTNVYYPVPLHELPAFDGKCVHTETGATEEACQCVLSLPIGPYITEEEIHFVSEKIKEFYKN